MTPNTKPFSAGSTPDYSLLVSRLEGEVLSGKSPEKCSAVLSRKDIWQRLSPSDQMRWARLAQSLGQVELTLEILAHVNHTAPAVKQAWQSRLELLMVMDRRREMVRVLALARDHLSDAQCQAWFKITPGRENIPVKDDAMDAAAEPFVALQEHRRHLARFMEFFSGREDCFARQWADKIEGRQGYVPVRRPFTQQDLEEHLAGRKTYGIYLLKADATVRVAVLDMDLRKNFREEKPNREDRALIRREGAYAMKRIRDMSESAGCAPLVEFSGGKGYHFWFIFDRPVPAARAKAWLSRIRDPLYRDLSAFSLEVFPKQGELSGKGMGNLVKLPLGVHRGTGKRSYFYDCADRGIKAQLKFLLNKAPDNVDRVVKVTAEIKKKNVVVHPRLQKWAEDFPELRCLETACPPLGQIFAQCRQGRALTEREEKILYQTVGFLGRAKTLLHHLVAPDPEYNPHLVDFRLSRLRGKPLGCRRIHSLLNFTGDMCVFLDDGEDYDHPLRHLPDWKPATVPKAEKALNLQDALENLNVAMRQVKRFMDTGS